MGCMFCGKEIGPLRLTHDHEFCTPSHRQLYRERLNESRGQAEVVELRPAGATASTEGMAPAELAADATAGSRAKLLTFHAADRPPAPAAGIANGPTVLCSGDEHQGEETPEEADFIPLDYHCARAAAAPSVALEWTWRSPTCALPPLGLQPIGESLEELSALKGPAMRPLPAAAPPAKQKKHDWGLAETAAAVVVLAVLAGFGMRFTSRIGTETPAVKRDAAAVAKGGKSGGPLEKFRHAIAERAAVELSDSFKSGMAAWGHGASWAPGWNRHPDGYMQTGQLALFQPSMKFTDYRMEFYGQIESKSIGWVVRAQDTKNYYAMKLTVIQPGLRPIIAMVHYPVIDGHAGKPVETPLPGVMVHNDTAYRVSVAVKGNRIVTAFDGQEVDRWTEDRAIPSGGVGFYSESGERARLYWMMVSKNNDFLGKVCAYLSGSAEPSQALASLLPIGWNE